MNQVTAVVGVLLCFGAVAAQRASKLSTFGKVDTLRPSKLSEECSSSAAYINSCRTASDPAVASGNHEGLARYAHMAIIGYGNETSIKWVCAGSLISEKYVLTAAHCASHLRLSEAYVMLGDFVSKEEKTKSQVYGITSIINHPNYKTSSMYNDISLLKLNASVKFTNFIRPICLSNDTQIPEGKVIATSWTFGTGDLHHKTPSEAESVIETEEECRGFYNSSGNLRISDGIKYETMICANTPWNSGKDTCIRDIGGPLQIHHPGVPCLYLQVGITSFGPVCSDKNTVYTRVSHFVPWIESVLWI